MKKGLCWMFLAVLGMPLFAQPFTADTSAVNQRSEEHSRLYEQFPTPPYLAVYQKGNKKLVVLAARHGAESLPSVQYAFDVYSPQVALVERAPGEAFSGSCSEAEASYTAALSGKHQIPLVRADVTLEQQWLFAKENGFSYEDWQMLWMIRDAYYRSRETDAPLTAQEAIATYARRDHHEDWGKLFTEKRLNRYFKKHYKQDFEETNFVQLFQDLMNIYPEKWVVKTPFYKLNNATSLARSQFMLENIAAALNQYDVVFIEMGAGHFLDLAQALQEMIGQPQVIDGRQLPPQPVWKDCALNGVREIILMEK